MAKSTSYTIKVAVYEDNSALRCSLSKLIQTSALFELTGAFPDARQVIENCQNRTPDVILMDIDMPFITGIEAVGLLRKPFPGIHVLMLTVFEDNEKVLQSICHGADGYILKKTDPNEILDAIKEVYSGGAPMTPFIAANVIRMFRHHAPEPAEHIDLSTREREILLLLTRGFSYKMVATECNICIDTVRYHIKKIYEKLQVHSMTEAVSKAIKNRLV